MQRARETHPDETVAGLARLFREHPAWRTAAGFIAAESASNVYFRHRPGEAWHLIRRGGETLLERGPVDDPDFVFRFGPGSVERLAAVRGDVGDFAIALFELMEDPSPDRGVDFRVAASWLRLWRRGYARLLLEAGSRVWAFGARRGVRSWSSLRRLVSASRGRGPFDWEVQRARRR